MPIDRGHFPPQNDSDRIAEEEADRAEALEKAAASAAWEDAEAAYRLYVQENGYPRDGRSTWCLAWTGALSAARSSSPEAERLLDILEGERDRAEDRYERESTEWREERESMLAEIARLSPPFPPEAVPAHSEDAEIAEHVAAEERLCADLQRYAGQWVAVRDHAIVDHADTLAVLVERAGKDTEVFRVLPSSHSAFASTEQIEAEERVRRELIGGEIEALREGMGELGFSVGVNPDGVDDTVAATLLIVRDLLAARPESGKTREETER